MFFFFKQAAETADTSWLSHLGKRGYLANPRNAERIGEDRANFPFWWPMHYLAKISKHAPDIVVSLVLGFPKVDNPSVYDDILAVALQLRGEQSAKLMPKVFESLKLEHRVWTHHYADLLAHWTVENQIEAALELSIILVSFAPDPKSRTKQKRRRENPPDFGMAWETSLEPSPRIDRWEYCEIMSKGVRPLAEKEPYKVACILINATANMIRLRTHQDNSAHTTDYSDIWWDRLCESENNYADHKTTLVHTLTFACEQVYQKSPDAVVALDTILQNQQWKVFKRLRHHLYAQYPNETTKPWIRDLILTHKDYHRWEHHYEFQQLIRSACGHFGTALLSDEERKHIFDCIRNGPSQDGFTEEEFRQHQRRFHRKQFKPFAPVLFGEYKTYFQELENAGDAPISDEDYPPLKTRGGHVLSRSPCSPEDLTNLTDEELLTCINEWDEKKELFEGNNLIEVDIGGLSLAFQTVFKEQIIPDSNRFRFWVENCEKIERPIYVRMMIIAMQANLGAKKFNNLCEWLRFCEWVLVHPDDSDHKDYDRHSDESRENPEWSNSRRAVVDFIGVCLGKDVEIPISARGQLAKLLEMLCTQFDSWLDLDKRVFLNQDDPIAEGINNTRSLALEALVKFGFWLRRHNSESESPEVTTILERRFASETGHLLTLPEYAILGRNYNWIFSLNERWATEHKSDFFPQKHSPAWQAAFSSFICYNDPKKLTFEILWGDFDFALQHLADFKKQDFAESQLTETLGDHLFHYYMWDMYPLNGANSLLERFYQVTDRDRKQWAALFNNVGFTLHGINTQLDESQKDKIIDFFNWRFKVQEPTELQQFTFWLQAGCLEADWRLDACSKILNVCKAEGVSIAIQVETLYEMLPDHTAKVIECFAKLTDGHSRDGNNYIYTEEAKTILKAGLANTDHDVRQNAERARENLLRAGRFDLLDLDD